MARTIKGQPEGVNCIRFTQLTHSHRVTTPLTSNGRRSPKRSSARSSSTTRRWWQSSPNLPTFRCSRRCSSDTLLGIAIWTLPRLHHSKTLRFGDLPTDSIRWSAIRLDSTRPTLMADQPPSGARTRQQAVRQLCPTGDASTPLGAPAGLPLAAQARAALALLLQQSPGRLQTHPPNTRLLLTWVAGQVRAARAVHRLATHRELTAWPPQSWRVTVWRGQPPKPA